jgi:hypothetical protein
MDIVSLVTAGVGLVGTLIVAGIGLWGLSWLAKRTARIKAGKRLCKAFEPELAALDPASHVTTVFVKDLRKTAWLRHYGAVIEMRVHLSPKEQAGLDAAWGKYTDLIAEIAEMEFMAGDSQDHWKEKYSLPYCDNVYAILEYGGSSKRNKRTTGHVRLSGMSAETRS